MYGPTRTWLFFYRLNWVVYESLVLKNLFFRWIRWQLYGINFYRHQAQIEKGGNFYEWNRKFPKPTFTSRQSLIKFSMYRRFNSNKNSKFKNLYLTMTNPCRLDNPEAHSSYRIMCDLNIIYTSIEYGSCVVYDELIQSPFRHNNLKNSLSHWPSQCI